MRMLAALSLVVSAAAFAAPMSASAQTADEIARGGYLVKAMGCGDCHTPKKMGPDGPMPDVARGLSGHPQDVRLPPPPAPQGPWIAGDSATITAFWGPWGISYSSNLTPDATGLGAWKAADFIKTMRVGKHLGVGRPLLPPMPWPSFGQLTDADLGAVFAYLMSQPAVANQVPTPTPPAPR